MNPISEIEKPKYCDTHDFLSIAIPSALIVISAIGGIYLYISGYTVSRLAHLSYIFSIGGGLISLTSLAFSKRMDFNKMNIMYNQYVRFHNSLNNIPQVQKDNEDVM